MRITQEIILDTSRENAFKYIHAKRFDENSRFLKATIATQGEALIIPSTATVVFRVRWDKGKHNFRGSVNDDGTVTVPLSNTMLQNDGKYLCSISLIENGEKLSTLNFTILVEDAVTSDEELTEDDNYDILVSLISDVNSVLEKADELEAAVSATVQSAKEASEAAIAASEALQNAQDQINSAQELADRAETAASEAEGFADKAEEIVATLESIPAGLDIITTDDGKKLMVLVDSDGNLVGEGAETSSDATLFQADSYDNLSKQKGKNIGDIGVVTEVIHDGKESKTAYTWDGSIWIALDGNYSAENVYFDEDFTFTKGVGTVTIPSSGKIVVGAAGKSVKEFFAGIFAKEEYPTIPTTSASITSSNIGAVEVGTRIAVQYAFSTIANNYAWNQAHGVTWSDYSATFNGETKTDSSGTFTELQVTDSTNLSITGSVKQSAGAIPKTNLGNDYPDAQIQAKDWTGLTKGTLTGYRAWFCGYLNGDNAIKDSDGKADATLITGAQVRNLGNIRNGSWLSSMYVDKMQQMFFAAPAGRGYKPVVKDSSTTAPQTVLGPITVYVKGANNYVASGNETTNGGMAYDVWYVNVADAASGSATLNITRT